MDDFGTGFSSLAYLKKLPIDVLKIDKSFIDDIDKVGQPIVEFILGLSKSLGMKTVAEGVETKNQADWLVKSGCDVLQGYHFARPLSPEDCIEFLHKIGKENC